MIDRESFLGHLAEQLLISEFETGDSHQPDHPQILAAAEGIGQWIYGEMARSSLPKCYQDMNDFGQALASLKNTLGGCCTVLKGTSSRVTLGVQRCPFQSWIHRTPYLCLVTAGVFGAMTRCRFGYSRVTLERTIAEGYPECLVTVSANHTPGAWLGKSLEFSQTPAVDHHRLSVALRTLAVQSVPVRHRIRSVSPGLLRVKNRLENSVLLGLFTGLFAGEDENLPLQQLASLGWRPATKYRVMVATIDKSASAPISRHPKASLLRQAFHHSLPGCLIGWWENTGLAILARETDSGVPLPQRAAKIRSHLSELTNELVTIAMGGSFTHLSEAQTSYLQACAAMHVQESLGRKGEVISFDQLGVYRLFQYLRELPQVNEIARQTLGPLYTYDQRRSSSLVNTLEEYFRNDCSVQATAKVLFIHPTTVKYRLRRAQEIGGFDLSRVEDRLSLLLNLRLIGTTHTKQTLKQIGTGPLLANGGESHSP